MLQLTHNLVLMLYQMKTESVIGPRVHWAGRYRHNGVRGHLRIKTIMAFYAPGVPVLENLQSQLPIISVLLFTRLSLACKF